MTVHSAIDGAQSTPLPWQPSDEAPGWWARLTRRYFPAFEQVAVSDWDSVIRAVAEPGPDTRGLVWVRRELGGAEATGNLLYAHNHKGQVVFLDAQVGVWRSSTRPTLRDLVLMRAVPRAQPPRRPWEAEAHDYSSALRKAQLWLDQAYHGEAELVDPAPQDEIRRGWVFACNTKRHLRDGRWQDAMLDATLVVPRKQPLRSAFPTPTHGPGCNAGTPAGLPDPRDSPSRRLPVTRHGSNPPCPAWGPCSPRPNTRTGQR